MSNFDHVASDIARLCDLRNIRGSEQMGSMLVSELQKAFNNGDILPTGSISYGFYIMQGANEKSVFVFPPRETDKAGPMIWNSQLLSFAGVGCTVPHMTRR